ncbi:gamma-glutamyltranspeptidase [Mesorhizobium sp. Root554]|uniref:gamma-glutamyltransferase n=1 Tax=unclassified Mesorhizobium TaxID=325217 RepID=UPI00070085F2|nr:MULTISPECIES: gamma-glutamyltransferase [unclassified Mesorhizobium]KQZ12642.1 gamma-glutamyltranspeptidase [Mesorhizobium sp. Root1471]KQZ35164.1 gamma-glutamyltranspeptidase [Mesorhizobium sp. Root554]
MEHRWKLRAAAVLALTLGVAVVQAPSFAASPAPVKAEHGMVVTAHHLASEIGVEALKKGGNAVDAAVAVGYALAVAYPQAGNIGGGGFMTVRFAHGKSTFIDFRERAPLAATKTMYLDKDGKIVKGASLDGYLAIGIPGSVAGFEYAREKYGKLSRNDLIEPALRLARDGFELTDYDASSLNAAAKRLDKDPAAKAIFTKSDGKPFAAGDRLVQEDLAASLMAIEDKGADGFYKGAAADAIVRASQAKGGVLAKADFEGYAVREMKPVECSYRGYQIVSSPPPSSGGIIICEILNILEAYPLSYLGPASAETAHLMIEAMRHAYIDRNSALGDPDFVENPVSKLLDKDYAAGIRAKIDPYRAGVSKELMPKGLGESTETTHYSIIDDEGTAVAVTYTLNGSYGAGVVAEGTGILLNNEMDDFTSKPGEPNLYGLVQGEANAIEPKKTPLSSMSPTIVAKDGKPFMVIGSPGGPRIITITLEAILNVIDHGMDIQEAVDAPRIHHQWLPDTVYAEPYALSPDTARLLTGMGYKIEVSTKSPTWGQAAGILVGGESLAEAEAGGGARYNGAIDSRAASGLAAGY